LHNILGQGVIGQQGTGASNQRRPTVPLVNLPDIVRA
jgi:hypothetical protein